MGKTFWIHHQFPDAFTINLLQSQTYNRLLARPSLLREMIPQPRPRCIFIDEVQKVPALLDEVHDLIESENLLFILSGSSARKLKRGGANLLGGRARNCKMYPLTAPELSDRFDLQHALRYGMLPLAWLKPDPEGFLHSYLETYLKEEVLAEGLTRNLPAFSRFLEAASFSQGQPLNVSNVAKDSDIDRKVAEGYFQIIEDLLLAARIPIFQTRAKRKHASHPKFYFFDCGVYRTIRPSGPLDPTPELEGPALETLFLQHLQAVIEARSLRLEVHYWRNRSGREVDFVCYGKDGFHAFEVMRSSIVQTENLAGLKEFRKDYPAASCSLLYGGRDETQIDGIRVLPFERALREVPRLLGA